MKDARNWNYLLLVLIVLFTPFIIGITLLGVQYHWKNPTNVNEFAFLLILGPSGFFLLFPVIRLVKEYRDDKNGYILPFFTKETNPNKSSGESR